MGAIVSLMDMVKFFFVERFERQLRGAANGPPPKVDMPGGSSKPVPELQAEICARFAGIGTSQRRLFTRRRLD